MGAVWKNIIFRCDSVFVAYLYIVLSNLYIGYINYTILYLTKSSTNMTKTTTIVIFEMHFVQYNIVDISDMINLLYQIYFVVVFCHVSRTFCQI